MENDLISRSALIAYVKELPTYDPTDRGFIFKRYPSGLFAPDDILKSIQYAPAVDPETLRPKGRWVNAHDMKPCCSECGKYRLFLWSDYMRCNYCPNCGADMRGDDNARD